MAKKLLVVVPLLALLIAIIVQQIWSRSLPTDPLPSPPTSAVVTNGPPPASAGLAMPTEREAVAQSGEVSLATTPPFDPSPVQVAPWSARILVVDEQDEPVADAAVTFWTAKKLRLDPSDRTALGKDYAYFGRGEQSLFVMHTDADGRTAPLLEVECVNVTASKGGFVETEGQLLHRDYASATEKRFVLQVPTTLRGVVLRADGIPASGAKVFAFTGSSMRIGGNDPPKPEPVISAADGGFELIVCTGARYVLCGELGEATTFRLDVVVRDRNPPDVILTFPGAITIEGLVVDAEGAPVVDAGVTVWRECHIEDLARDRSNFESVDGATDGRGRFSLSVQRHARYQLIARSGGLANSKLLWVETTLVRPHVEVRIELRKLALIQGRTVFPDGSPVAGARVGARPEVEVEADTVQLLPEMGPEESLFGRVGWVLSGDDGSFSLAVHPEPAWTIVAGTTVNGARMGGEVTGVAAGAMDVILRLEKPAECIVIGTVVRSDGLPVGECRIDIVTGQPGSGREGRAEFDGAKFTLAPLTRGEQYSVRVTPIAREQGTAVNGSPVAPTQVGPFVAEGATLELEFRLEAWGEVPVRVVGADGKPATQLLVTAMPDTFVGGALPQKVDASGCVVLTRRVPGANRLMGVSDGVLLDQNPPPLLFDQPLRIIPGRNREVVVQLVAPPPNKSSDGPPDGKVR